MNWTSTPAQREALRYLEESPSDRYTDRELLDLVVRKWRELRYPPRSSDMGEQMSMIVRRLGGWKRAVERASKLLTEKERRQYVPRCGRCRREFKTNKARTQHEKSCTERL